jgi:hypothetical protein
MIAMLSAFGPMMPPGSASVSLTYLASERVVPGYGGGEGVLLCMWVSGSLCATVCRSLSVGQCATVCLPPCLSVCAPAVFTSKDDM